MLALIPQPNSTSGTHPIIISGSGGIWEEEEGRYGKPRISSSVDLQFPVFDKRDKNLENIQIATEAVNTTAISRLRR